MNIKQDTIHTATNYHGSFEPNALYIFLVWNSDLVQKGALSKWGLDFSFDEEINCGLYTQAGA